MVENGNDAPLLIYWWNWNTQLFKAILIEITSITYCHGCYFGFATV